MGFGFWVFRNSTLCYTNEKKVSQPLTISEQQIQACLLQLVRDRGPAKTICPSEVARALS
ncbi:MAG: DUF3253 domain-containing protein, partial [Cyanobacteria bacterium P01_D01_bin.6]